MAESIALDKTIEDYIQDQQKKALREKHDETLACLANSLERRRRLRPIYIKQQTKRWRGLRAIMTWGSEHTVLSL